MSHAACTVSVVTTDGPAGRAGVTVSAMTSVSADTPQPTLLVCVHHRSAAAPAILANGVFCVNVLRDDQSYISEHFAGRTGIGAAERFACAAWTAQKTGAPRVVDPLVAFDCRLLSGERVGTHHVFVGAVEEIFVAHGGTPLIYANRAYGTPTRLDTGKSMSEGSRTLRLGAFHTFGPYIVPDVLERLARAGMSVDLRLLEGDHRHLVEALHAGEIELALLYDLGLDGGIARERLAALPPHVLLPEGHPLAAAGALGLAELAGEPLILLDAPPSGEYFLSLFASAGVAPTIRARCRSFEMVRGLVGHGLGYSVLATKPASAMSYDGRALTTRPLRGAFPPSHIALAWRDGTTPGETAAAFMTECRHAVAQG